MMELTFEAALAILSTIEGGWSTDAGGTQYGVIQQTYDTYRRRRGLVAQPVAHISKEEAADIYKTQYWQPLHCGDMKPAWGLVLFVQAVNLPWLEAAKIVQGTLTYLRLYEGEIDGDIGPATIQATMKAYQGASQLAIAAMAGHYAIDASNIMQKGLIVRRLNMLWVATKPYES